MEATILTATPEAAGQRLDAFLAAALPELTRSAAQRLIAGGQVAVDGKIPAKSLKLSAAFLKRSIKVWNKIKKVCAERGVSSIGTLLEVAGTTALKSLVSGISTLL